MKNHLKPVLSIVHLINTSFRKSKAYLFVGSIIKYIQYVSTHILLDTSSVFIGYNDFHKCLEIMLSKPQEGDFL